MIESLLVLFAGIAAIYFGGRWVVSGASHLAARLGVRPFVIALTIVGFGTSAPELALGIIANSEGHAGVTLGNVIGANLTNLTYIIGISALIAPIAVRFSLIRREGLVAIGAICLLLMLGLTGVIGTLGGIVMLMAFLIYLVVLLSTLERCDPGKDVTCQFDPMVEVGWTLPKTAGVLALGLLLLIVGAQAILTGAVDIARDANLSEVVIGLTIVSIGSTLPELTIAIMAARRHQPDLIVGNALGTVIFNTLVIIGLGGIITPMVVSPMVLLLGIVPVLAVVALFYQRLQTKGGIDRKFGAIFIVIYVIYVILLMVFS